LDGSKILESRMDADLIAIWTDVKEIQSDLLYRGTRDGFTASKFHELCDD